MSIFLRPEGSYLFECILEIKAIDKEVIYTACPRQHLYVSHMPDLQHNKIYRIRIDLKKKKRNNNNITS